MKLKLTHNDFSALPYPVQKYLFDWQKRKGYPYNPLLTIGEAIEFLCDESRNLHHEVDLAGELTEMSSSYFNTVLRNEGSIIAFEGNELLDALVFETVQVVKKRLASIPYSKLA